MQRSYLWQRPYTQNAPRAVSLHIRDLYGVTPATRQGAAMSRAMRHAELRAVLLAPLLCIEAVQRVEQLVFYSPHALASPCIGLSCQQPELCARAAAVLCNITMIMTLLRTRAPSYSRRPS